MNFGSRSEKVSRRIAQMEADLKALQKESDTLTGRVDDPAVQRPFVRHVPVSGTLNNSPVTKSDYCLRSRAARTAAVH